MFTLKITRAFRLEYSLNALCALWVLRIRALTPTTAIPPLVTKGAAEIEEALLKHAVIPDVIDKAPKHFLMASFRESEAKKAKFLMPQLGNILDPKVMRMYPYHLNWPCDNASMYTLIMTDPDYPSKQRPSMREWHHWLVGNIHVVVKEGNFLPDIFESDMMSRYVPPNPQNGTGFHRYIFLVYKQPTGRIRFEEKYLPPEPNDIERGNFSTRRFAEKYNLGDPIAVSFSLCEWVKLQPTTTSEPSELTTFNLNL
ncbi:protein D1 [Bemisia tabaci]|uniref:protein D1 n=1 Tax=Bemisia tabaci TaxID=7038 RepID=UPI003B28DCAB